MIRARIARIPNVHTDPAPDVEILEFNAAGTKLVVRPYCHNDHYWQVYFDTNRTIKEATVKRYHYDSHAQLTVHLHDFINAYNYGRRLKTLRGLTPYEYICKIWTSEPDRFNVDPIHQMPGLNT